MGETVKVAAVQTKRRTISYKASTVKTAFEQVRTNLIELVTLAERAAAMGCQIIGFPEDTLGVGSGSLGGSSSTTSSSGGGDAFVLWGGGG